MLHAEKMGDFCAASQQHWSRRKRAPWLSRSSGVWGASRCQRSPPGDDELGVAGGATVVCHPFFLSQGRHVREDVPALLDEAASRHNVPYSLTPPLGEAPALLDLVHDVVSAGVKEATPDADDGGFGFFGAIAEMIEAENAASR